MGKITAAIAPVTMKQKAIAQVLIIAQAIAIFQAIFSGSVVVGISIRSIELVLSIRLP
jgi:hypothetical protein